MPGIYDHQRRNISDWLCDWCKKGGGLHAETGLGKCGRCGQLGTVSRTVKENPKQVEERA